MITKKIQLEMAIESIQPHPTPKVDLEQYNTPAKMRLHWVILKD